MNAFGRFAIPLVFASLLAGCPDSTTQPAATGTATASTATAAPTTSPSATASATPSATGSTVPIATGIATVTPPRTTPTTVVTQTPALAAKIKAKLGASCTFERACGALWGIDCQSASDGPYYYVKADTLDEVAACGGRCMGGRCTNCPPKEWTCATY
ncbi:hypothetical protein BH09MYX1_BH09MYX1_59160 [soil metagenome]